MRRPSSSSDFDLFGYPIHGLTEVLDSADRKLLLPANVNPQSTHYLSAVRLDACEGDRWLMLRGCSSRAGRD